MNSFLAHVGAGNAIDLEYTLTQKRSFEEVVRKLPRGPERDYFEKDEELHRAFPDGVFNVWGVPEGAAGPFFRTRVGDTVFFAPSVGQDGCVRFFWRREGDTSCDFSQGVTRPLDGDGRANFSLSLFLGRREGHGFLVRIHV